MTRFFDSPGGKLAYTDSGKGEKTLLFLHGLPTSKELYVPVIRQLKGPFRCITYDFFNYGESEKGDVRTPHVERARRAGALMDHLHVHKFILVAHDVGSSVAIDMMALFKERIEKLIIASPPVYPDYQEPFIVKFLRIPVVGPVLIALFKNILLTKAMKKGLVNKKNYNLYLRSFLEKAFKGKMGSKAIYLNLNWGSPKEVFKNYPDIIRKIEVPVLVIQGKQDPYIPVQQPRRLAEDVKNGLLEFIEDGSHFLPIDTPDQLARLIEMFILDTH